MKGNERGAAAAGAAAAAAAAARASAAGGAPLTLTPRHLRLRSAGRRAKAATHPLVSTTPPTETADRARRKGNERGGG